MAKKKNKILSDYNTTVTANELMERLDMLENFVIMQSKLLNTNILRTAAIVELLSKKKKLTHEAVEKKSKELLAEIKEKSEKYREGTIFDLADMIDDEVGHA
jgi:nicotinamide mononucleotide adenylyltransferase